MGHFLHLSASCLDSYCGLRESRHWLISFFGLYTLKLCQRTIADSIIDRWDHETNKQGDEGFMGKVQAFRKKTDAKLVDKMVPSDPSKV